MTNLEPCLAGFQRRGSTRAALWLGNSQLHGVNQWKEGDETAPARLFAHLHERGLDLITLSQPNANLQEHLVLYAYAADAPAAALPHLAGRLRRRAARRASAAWSRPRSTIRARAPCSRPARSAERSSPATKPVANPDLAALDQTLQERTETALDSLARPARRAVGPATRGARPDLALALRGAQPRLRDHAELEAAPHRRPLQAESGRRRGDLRGCAAARHPRARLPGAAARRRRAALRRGRVRALPAARSTSSRNATGREYRTSRRSCPASCSA